MALAGLSVGNGRAAFRSATGQLLTLVAVLLVIGCWLWAGRILRVPEEQRVFELRAREDAAAAGGAAGEGYDEEEVVGPKLVPTTPIMRFAMREVVQEYYADDDRTESEYASLSDADVQEY